MTFQITDLSHIVLMIFRVDTGATLTRQNWQDLAQATIALNGFWTLVQQRVGLSQHKFSLGAGNEYKEAVLRLDLNNRHKDELIAKLNERAALYGISGNIATKAQEVLLAELKDAAVNSLGYSQNAANKLIVGQFKLYSVGEGDPLAVHRQSVLDWYAYRTARSAVWGSGE